MKDFKLHHAEIKHLMAELGIELPAPMAAFSDLHNSALKEGSLSTKTKELIALGIAISVRCDGCIAFHVHDALESGATREELVETIGVAVLMGGGPSLIYGIEAFEALNQFAEEEVPES